MARSPSCRLFLAQTGADSTLQHYSCASVAGELSRLAVQGHCRRQQVAGVAISHRHDRQLKVQKLVEAAGYATAPWYYLTGRLAGWLAGPESGWLRPPLGPTMACEFGYTELWPVA